MFTVFVTNIVINSIYKYQFGKVLILKMKLKIYFLLILGLLSCCFSTRKIKSRNLTKQNNYKTIVQYDKLTGKQLLKPNDLIFCIAEPTSSDKTSKGYVFTPEWSGKSENFNIVIDGGTNVWKIKAEILDSAVPYIVITKGVFYQIAIDLFFLKNKLLKNIFLTELENANLVKSFTKAREIVNSLFAYTQTLDKIEDWAKLNYIIHHLTIKHNTSFDIALLIQNLNKINIEHIEVLNTVIDAKAPEIYNLSKLMLKKRELLNCLIDNGRNYITGLQTFLDKFLIIQTALNKGRDNGLKKLVNSLTTEKIRYGVGSLYKMGLNKLNEFIKLHEIWQIALFNRRKETPLFILNSKNKELIESIFNGIPKPKLIPFLKNLRSNLDNLEQLIQLLKSNNTETILNKVNDLMGFVDPFIIDVDSDAERYIVNLNNAVDDFIQIFRHFKNYVTHKTSQNKGLNPQDFATDVNTILKRIDDVVGNIKVLLTNVKLKEYFERTAKDELHLITKFDLRLLHSEVEIILSKSNDYLALFLQIKSGFKENGLLCGKTEVGVSNMHTLTKLEDNLEQSLRKIDHLDTILTDIRKHS
jgi:uncharacterized protein YoxC